MNKITNTIKVLIYPKHINHGAQNPYQNLLYENIIKNKELNLSLVNYLFFGRPSLGALLFPFKLIYYKLIGYNILHIQFLYPFYPLLKYKLFKIIYFFNLKYNLIIIKLLGFKLVWTLHETIPHDPQFIDDVSTRKLVARYTSAIIVHSKNTINEMRNLGYDTSSTFITPHGNFIDIYKNTITKLEARQYFQINNEDLVLLLFGILSPYKGINNLINSANIILSNNKYSKIKFLIAGKPSNEDILGKLHKLKNKFPNNIILKLHYIDNEKIQFYYNAADIVVCPFTHINTSSTAILALSLKKPLIYPFIGDFVDLPSNIGFCYDPKNFNGLTEAIEMAFKNKKAIAKMSKSAFTYAKKLSWKKAAKGTLNIYKEVLINDAV